MFRSRRFNFGKVFVPTVTLKCVLHAEVTIKVFYKISKYNIFELCRYSDMNTQYSS